MMDIEKFRAEIDRIDEEIIRDIKKRFEIVHKIGEYKKKNNLDVHDDKRVQEVYEKREKIAQELGLDTEMIRNIFFQIIESATNYQINNNKGN